MRLKLTPLIAITALSLVVSGCTGTPDSPDSTPSATDHADEWSYVGATGPDHWGNIHGECAITHDSTQSPIDITEENLVAGDSLSAPIFNYSPSSFRVENNGHTIQAAPHDLKQNSITLDGDTFYLQQFHLHNPGEHTLDGVQPDMELHLVHTNAQNKIAVVGVMLNGGAENAALEELFTTMPTSTTSKGDEIELVHPIDPNDLLPSDRRIARYTGSLTTPPCTEGILWNVFKAAGEVSAEQIDAFAAIFPDNHRPVQPLNDRQVTKVE
ncbi:carbonic anhydrase family protein [Lysinibacter sp. HNR]|uniref:carbonic anhydrase n=1 Tax=Lysinibacter sp. HNR TaxID=3031408 RepID=UPI0024352305|nr:carbonic anhydrase family protein [Lysinibacter sp. HNR]WGD36605.1 carbonic anhydrase family protein [Lysinibacter sp. HNR]